MTARASSISVIIPTFNRASLVMRALRSVFGQTRAPDEVLVIDDGSTDQTAEQVEKYFPHVRYIWQENRGVSAARNRGIQETSGEWIAFLDSDDEWKPRKLERQLASLTANASILVCHTEETWIRNGTRVNPMKKHQKYGGHIFQRCLPLCVISPSSTMIHRSIFEEVGTFDESLPACEDYDLWLRVCVQFPILYLEEPLVVKYGGHADQLSGKYWGLDRFRIQALEKILTAESLSSENRRATVQTLLQKIDIYLQGAEKRGKEDEVATYQRKREQFARLLDPV